jgi:hypothetical protein
MKTSLLNLTKPFNSGLGQYMRQAAYPSGGVDSSNPSLQAAGGTSGSITMVMVLLGHLSFLCKLLILKGVISP